MSPLLLGFGVYAVIFGAICYSMAERKGVPKGEAFFTGLLLGVLGLVWMVAKPDVRRGWQPTGPVKETAMAPIVLAVGVFIAIVAAAIYLAR